MDIAGFLRSDLVIANAAAYRRMLVHAGVATSQIVSLPWGVAPQAIEQFPLMRRDSGAYRVRWKQWSPEKDNWSWFRRSAYFDASGQTFDWNWWDPLQTPLMSGKSSGLFGNISCRTPSGSAVGFATCTGMSGTGNSLFRCPGTKDMEWPFSKRWRWVCQFWHANAPGVQDYLRAGKNAMALKSDSVRTVAETRRWALDHPETTRKLSVKARKMVRNTYAWERTVLGMETIYGIREDSGLASNG